jgi:hypothetical protein
MSWEKLMKKTFSNGAQLLLNQIRGRDRKTYYEVVLDECGWTSTCFPENFRNPKLAKPEAVAFYHSVSSSDEFHPKIRESQQTGGQIK